MLITVLFAHAPATVIAQAPSAAVVVEWSHPSASTVREVLQANLRGRGWALSTSGSVDAARAFSGRTGPLDDSGVVALRQQLNVHEVIWVAVRRREGRLLIAVQRVTPAGVARQYGSSSAAEVSTAVIDLLDAAFNSPLTPITVARLRAAPAQADPVQLAPIGASPVGVAPPQVAPIPATPVGVTPAQVAPFGAPRSAVAPVGPIGVASRPVDAAPIGGPSAPAAVPVEAAPVGVAVAAVPAPSPPAASTDAAMDPDPVPRTEAAPSTSDVVSTSELGSAAPQRTERLRVAIVAFAGIEQYGYGLGARVEIPLVSLLDGVDDSLCLGIDLGLAYADVGLDAQGNGYHAFQVPAAAYATWRFGFGDLEIGPRLGVILVPSFGAFRGPVVSGTRVSFLGMVLVGVTGAIRVADGVQIFAGLDLGFGTRINGLISAGVAL